jgi:hypothetical protein
VSDRSLWLRFFACEEALIPEEGSEFPENVDQTLVHDLFALAYYNGTGVHNELTVSLRYFSVSVLAVSKNDEVRPCLIVRNKLNGNTVTTPEQAILVSGVVLIWDHGLDPNYLRAILETMRERGMLDPFARERRRAR